MKKGCFLFLWFVFIQLNVQADDELKNQNIWLVNFVEAGLSKAELTHSEESDLGYNQEIIKKYSFDFQSKEYHFSFFKTIAQNWDVLTQDGTKELPIIDKTYVSSKVEPWTNFKGMAKYAESYERTLPNWQNFNSISDLLVSLAKFNYDSPMNSMLYDDEVKALKKLYKSENSDLQMMWAQFSFDRKGNVTEYAGRYTKRFIESSSSELIKLTNLKGEQCFIESLNLSVTAAVGGVRVYQGDKEMIVFNEGLNEALHKFSPSVFAKPQVTFETYLHALSEKTNKSFERFESGLAENE